MRENVKLAVVGGVCGLTGLLVGAVFSTGSGTSKATAPTPEVAAPVELISPDPSVASNQAPPIEAAPVVRSDWRVDERTDPLTDETIKTACVTSQNQVYLSPPYGPRGAQLCIRQHPKFGRDVYLTLDGSGQILCNSYSGCTIQIRFDDKAVQSFSGEEPSDNSSEMIFVANDTRFISAARSASRIRVQVEFYQNGIQTFDFPAKGLEW